MQETNWYFMDIYAYKFGDKLIPCLQPLPYLSMGERTTLSPRCGGWLMEGG